MSALEIKNVSKYFPGVKALDRVNLSIKKGEIHCIVGENGAGKSTLIKILTGAFTQDEGEIVFNCCDLDCGRFHASKENITAVYQDVHVVDALSIAENIVLGEEERICCFNQKKKNMRRITPYLEQVRLNIDPRTQMSLLTCAQKQMVMIAKALAKGVKIIILDEPTAMLGDKEVETLFEIIRSLKNIGVTIIYISHRLKEIFDIGDRVTVLKDGYKVGTYNCIDIDENRLANLMVGREIHSIFPEKNKAFGETVLQVNNISNKHISNISFDLKSGEVLGIAGLVGSGRSELLWSIFGSMKIHTGEILIQNRKTTITPGKAIQCGIALVPENRRCQGIIGNLSVQENLTTVYSRIASKWYFRNMNAERQLCDKYISELNIKTPSKQQQVAYLSGGNQQKVVLGKWLASKPNILLLDEPTQGIDVGAKEEIYEMINKLARQGLGVLLVSSDMIEVINLCNRILVMREGKIAGEFSGNATEKQIVEYSMGVNAK